MNTGNIGQVIAWLNNWVDTFDFKRPGNDQSLGRDVMKLAAQRMRDRSLQDRTGFGTAWPPNSETPSHWAPEGYRAWKEKNYGTGDPNSRTGQMLSQLSMEGRSTIEAKQVTMIYGINKPPVTAPAFGNPDPKLLARDQKVTDTFKAYLAHTGQSRKKIVRPFYQLIDDDGIAISELCQENLNKLITETNQKNGY
jgi:hypothetical protein